MDLATLLGLLIAAGMLAASVVLSGGDFSSFWDASSLLAVVGGTLGAVCVCLPWKTARQMPGVFRRAMFDKPPDQAKVVEQIAQLAVAARKDGLLSLEPQLDQLDSPLLKIGLELAIDGREPELVQEVLRCEIESLAIRQRDAKAILDQCGRFAPAFGMIGTLLGLIIMLGNLSDPATIGSGMAVAMVTTLYGLVLANGLFLPLAEKLAALHRQEILTGEIVLRGVLALQAGQHPRVIQQKLAALLPPEVRPADVLPLRQDGQAAPAARRAA